MTALPSPELVFISYVAALIWASKVANRSGPITQEYVSLSESLLWPL
jgi:hypothetical protein